MKIIGVGVNRPLERLDSGNTGKLHLEYVQLEETCVWTSGTVNAGQVCNKNLLSGEKQMLKFRCSCDGECKKQTCTFALQSDFSLIF